jgi:hypothetical protein
MVRGLPPPTLKKLFVGEIRQEWLNELWRERSEHASSPDSSVMTTSTKSIALQQRHPLLREADRTSDGMQMNLNKRHDHMQIKSMFTEM